MGEFGSGAGQICARPARFSSNFPMSGRRSGRHADSYAPAKISKARDEKKEPTTKRRFFLPLSTFFFPLFVRADGSPTTKHLPVSVVAEHMVLSPFLAETQIGSAT